MAEYTAAGRAIMTDPLRYRLPGEFIQRQNFVQYDTPEECLCRLQELLRSPRQINRMESANFVYHNAHVRPDALVQRTLREAGVLEAEDKSL